MSRSKVGRALLAGLCSTCVLGQEVSASDDPSESVPESDAQSLSQAANDPTASLAAVQLQYQYVTGYHNLPGESGSFPRLRTVVPFSTGSLKQIARITLPFVADSPANESGLADAVLFDLAVFEHAWGRWGVGPVMLVPTATDKKLGGEKWAMGPAIGLVARKEKMLIGLFSQNLFTFAGDDDRTDINVSIIQPILNYSLPDHWSVGLSEMNITFDWKKRDWTNLPLGAKVSKLAHIGKLPVQFFAKAEYNFAYADDDALPEWTNTLGLKLLF